ncbi:MAG TPA: hypothetical protein PKO18_06950 [Chitinophagales bacterium]|nr:hypothetical protein [Chitinophagales bacterium]
MSILSVIKLSKMNCMPVWQTGSLAESTSVCLLLQDSTITLRNTQIHENKHQLYLSIMPDFSSILDFPIKQKSKARN